MKVSCIPICYYEELCKTREMSLSEWIRMAADVGLDGMEMYRDYLRNERHKYVEAVAHEIDKAGLEVSMLTINAELAAPSKEARLAQLKSLRRAMNTAALLRTKAVRVTPGTWPKRCGREESLSNVAECLKRLLDYAEEKGVVLALEEHPQIGTSTEDFTRILALVNDKRLKVNLDTSNTMLSGETAVRLTEIVKDRVVHVHASDRNQRLEHQVVGEGCVPFPEIFRILKKAGYDGWISLEAGGSKRQEGIAQGMKYVRTLWNKI